MNDLETIRASFIESLLWAESDDTETPLENNYSSDDVSTDSIDKITKLCAQFIANAKVGCLIEADDNQIGHDLYLTCAGHGAGFWDGDYPIYGDYLTKVCQSISRDIYAYIGDDNLVYIEV